MNRDLAIAQKIQAIEADLEELKRLIQGSKTHFFNLKGAWKGTETSEAAINEAKAALFKSAHERH